MALRNRRLEMGNKPVKGVADAVDSKDAVNKGQMDAAISAIDLSPYVEKTTQIIAGSGLSGGGALSSDVTLGLADTAVAPGSYTLANIEVDAQGRITAASNGVVPLPWTTVFKSADQSISSNINPANLADLSFSADASSIYVVRFVLFIMQGTGGARYDMNSTSAVSIGFRSGGFVTGAATTIDSDSVTSAFAGNYIAEEFAYIVTNSATTITVRGAQSSSNAAATTFKRGSYLEYRKIS